MFVFNPDFHIKCINPSAKTNRICSDLKQPLKITKAEKVTPLFHWISYPQSQRGLYRAVGRRLVSAEDTTEVTRAPASLSSAISASSMELWGNG